jgi:hypothetical protein
MTEERAGAGKVTILLEGNPVRKGAANRMNTTNP